MTQLTRFAPAIAQGAMTPQTRLAFEQARENWKFQRIAALLDELTFESDEQLALPLNMPLA